MRKSIEPTLARELILSVAPQEPETETLPLMSLFGRTLAQDMYALIAIPPFDRSPFDGYALRGTDTAAASEAAPVTLTITEEIAAGAAPTIALGAGMAAKILTGAPVPEGADATVKFEDTIFTDSTVTFTAPVRANSNIVRAGDDIACGELIARRGDVLTPAIIGLLAAVGLAEATVFRRPRVAILNTGSELAEPGAPLAPAQIYNSSAFSLIGALRAMGVDAYSIGVVPDDSAAIADRIQDWLPECDFLITTGGASVGDYDFAGSAAERLGARVLFWKVKMKPGGAMLAAELDGKLILSLSGNPGAALLGLQYIAAPFINRLAGQREIMPAPVEVRLRIDHRAGPRARLSRGYLEFEGGFAYFIERGNQGGSALASFRDCDLLAEIPASDSPIAAGTIVKAYRI